MEKTPEQIKRHILNEKTVSRTGLSYETADFLGDVCDIVLKSKHKEMYQAYYYNNKPDKKYDKYWINAAAGSAGQNSIINEIEYFCYKNKYITKRQQIVSREKVDGEFVFKNISRLVIYLKKRLEY